MRTLVVDNGPENPGSKDQFIVIAHAHVFDLNQDVKIVNELNDDCPCTN